MSGDQFSHAANQESPQMVTWRDLEDNKFEDKAKGCPLRMEQYSHTDMRAQVAVFQSICRMTGNFCEKTGCVFWHWR